MRFAAIPDCTGSATEIAHLDEATSPPFVRAGSPPHDGDLDEHDAGAARGAIEGAAVARWTVRAVCGASPKEAPIGSAELGLISKLLMSVTQQFETGARERICKRS